jgi:HEAT repeat protein
MPPHCDTLDGPVVKAASRALEEEKEAFVLPYVPKHGEDEVRAAFAKAVELRGQGDPAKELADRYFFETVVRIHRAGEGEPFTGLKPAGLDPGPVIPVAERALESGSGEELEKALCDVVSERVASQLQEVMKLKANADGDIEANRRYVSASLGLQVWAHKLYECAQSAPHEAHHHDHG